MDNSVRNCDLRNLSCWEHLKRFAGKMTTAIHGWRVQFIGRGGGAMGGQSWAKKPQDNHEMDGNSAH